MKEHLRILLICVVTSFLVASSCSVVTANTDCDLVDVVVILPASNDVTDSEFNDLKRTVLLLIRGMAISESKTRLATVNYGSVVGSSSTSLLGDRMMLGSSVMSMTKVGGSNDVRRGLEMARLLLNNYKRYEVPRVAVLIYKNVSMPAVKEAQQHAGKMAEDDIRVISIGIGSSVLSQLAWSQELVYNFTSSEKLLSAFREIPKYICKAIQTPNPESKIALSSTTMSSIDGKQTTEDYEEIPEICKRAKWVNGVGYAAVKGDVGAFAMCYKGLNNVMNVSYKECSQGQHWSEEDVTCVRFTEVATSKEVNSLCQLMPVHGSPNKFKQRTGFGLWKEFECPVGTLFSNETCGCSTFKISEYMAKQDQDSNKCTPELYLPFCGDLNDFSGKETYIQEFGHVRLREGKAYFDGKSYLFIPRFTGIKYGDTVVIKFRYLADDEEKYVNIEGVSHSLTRFSLISNGVCHGSRCDTPSSIFIGGKKGATIFYVVSAGDNFASYRYILSEHIRNKRQVSEDIGVKVGMQEELVQILQEPMAASMNYQENNLSSIGEGDSEEIRDDEPQIYKIEIPDRIQVSHSDARQQFEASQFQPSLQSFVTDTTHNDYDIILEPNNIINIQIPTTAVPTTFTEKIRTSERKIKLENTETDTKNNEHEDIDESNITDNEDYENENFDIIFNTSDTNDVRKLIHEIKGSNPMEESNANTSKYSAVEDSDMQDVQENVNYDILIDNSGEDIGELLSNIKGIKNKDYDHIKIGKSLSSEVNVGNGDNSTDSQEIDTPTINDLNYNPKDLYTDEMPFDNDATLETDLGVDVQSEISKDRWEATNLDLILNDTSSFNLGMIDTSDEEKDYLNENKINMTSLEVDEYVTSSEKSNNVTSLKVDKYDTSEEMRDNVTSIEVNANDTSTEKAYNVNSFEVDENETSTEKRDDVTPFEVDENETSTEKRDNVTSLEVDEYDTSTETIANVTLLENINNTDTATPNGDSSINTETETKKKGIWRSVTLEIKDGVIQASVDGRKEDERYFSGQIRTTQTGFYIGAGAGGQNFKGFIDEVYIYFCDPDEETVDEKYRKLLKERRLRELTDRKQNSKYSACDFVNPRAHEWLQTKK